ncbi:hypothetical protein DFH29DRAFT_954736, partial [Suillus ampliporus]
MMYCKTKDGVLVGVLNDYDLSSLATTQGPLGNERTGTVPFMALDLLSPESQRGKVQHLYRHDLESFIWVLVWKKYYVVGNFSRYEPSDIEPRIWNLVVECVRVLQQEPTVEKPSASTPPISMTSMTNGRGNQEFDMDDFYTIYYKFTSTK